MIDEVIVFYGSKKDFESLLINEIQEKEETIPFLELIQHYNARLRPNESGVKESVLSGNIEVDNCIVRSDDYGSVLEHVLSNFVGIVTLNYEIKKIFVHNPPQKVLRSLIAKCEKNISYRYSSYTKLDRDTMIEIYQELNDSILGQVDCKKQLIAGLYKLMSNPSNKPSVLLLYGPSGVGKTETAKIVSATLGGKLLRIQFSMMQTSEAYNYIFGAEHSRGSFARDMLSRESNVILIDEFDKVNPQLYNAFYELFDEGKYVDTNYEVQLDNSIFICTCNFKNEDEIKKALGPAMYSRIGCCIEYTELNYEEKCIIVRDWYNDVLENLARDEVATIIETDIQEWFIKNAERYNNVRILKNKLENAVFEELSKRFIFEH